MQHAHIFSRFLISSFFLCFYLQKKHVKGSFFQARTISTFVCKNEARKSISSAIEKSFHIKKVLRTFSLYKGALIFIGSVPHLYYYTHMQEGVIQHFNEKQLIKWNNLVGKVIEVLSIQNRPH